MAPRAWSEAEAEAWLGERELFGMRFGLDRMRRLAVALGHPERSFGSIHVVGTNGKSSTTRMAATLLAAHGHRTGAYLSPHLVALRERVGLAAPGAGLEDLPGPAFARAVGRAAAAVARVERTGAPDDPVTQFEALTAAAFDALAEHEVDVAVVEAGLGGRWDATSIIPSSVQVLTGVGLEHERWLGPTLRHIAREKLAVVRPGSTLVVGALAPEVAEEAQEAAARAGARLVEAGSGPDVPLGVLGRFQRRNFAVACAAVEAYLGRLEADRVALAARSVRVPGRLERIGDEPETLRDGAHNPGGMAALVESLPEVLAGRPLVAVVSILDDKDAAGMLRELLGACEHVVLTAAPTPRALSPGTLGSLVGQLAGPGGPTREEEPDPRRALGLARRRARALGGVVVATGSIYLMAALDSAPGHAAPAAAR